MGALLMLTGHLRFRLDPRPAKASKNLSVTFNLRPRETAMATRCDDAFQAILSHPAFDGRGSNAKHAGGLGGCHHISHKTVITNGVDIADLLCFYNKLRLYRPC